MRRVWQILILILVGVFSFTFFLYLSFPYDVLKETLAVESSKASGLVVSIDELQPSLMFGLRAKDIKIETPKGYAVKLRQLKVSVNPLGLLIGRIWAGAEIIDAKGGIIDADVSFKIFELISPQSLPLPSNLELSAKKFEIGKFGNLYIKKMLSDPKTNPLLKPVLEKVHFAGQLNGSVDLDLNAADFTRSGGDISLSMAKTSIQFDPSLQIPSQPFSEASVKLRSVGGRVKVDPKSRFRSQGLDIALSGEIVQKTSLEKSLAQLKVDVELFAKLKEQFGFLIDAFTHRSNDGKLSIKISGPLVPGPRVEF